MLRVLHQLVQVTQLKDAFCRHIEVVAQTRAVSHDMHAHLAHILILHNGAKRRRHKVVLGEQRDVEEPDAARARDLNERDIFARPGAALRVRHPLEVEAQHGLVEKVLPADMLHGVLAGAVVHADAVGGAVGGGAPVHGV